MKKPGTDRQSVSWLFPDIGMTLRLQAISLSGFSRDYALVAWYRTRCGFTALSAALPNFWAAQLPEMNQAAATPPTGRNSGNCHLWFSVISETTSYLLC